MTGRGPWAAWADEQLGAVRTARRWRQPRSFDALGPAGDLDGMPVTSFASNDYLGLSSHPAVAAAAHRAIDRWGTGATASRLVVGTRPVHADLEEGIADWKGTEAAVVLPSGYAANLAVLTTVASGGGATVLSDELNHASIIDGCRLARAEVRVYRHGDVDHLATLLSGAQRPVVVTDSVFSMDGDEAPVAELAALCAQHGALLVVDEAHAVLGPAVPAGECELLRVGTLSKSLGSLGGWVAGDRRFVDLLVNRARPFIFTTGLSPADAAAGLAALGVLRSDEGAAQLDRLRAAVARVRPGHPSPIVPIVLGSEQRALDASARLLQRGLWVPAIRPPTVAPGTSRLRVALSAAHTDAMLDALCDGLAGLDR